jgi:cadmium resistance protein CadD (predicted permease)
MSVTTTQAVELGALSFVATNVDNLVVFTTQLVLAPTARRSAVALGQLLASLVVVAMCVALNHVLVDLPLWSFGLLALVPFALCVKSAVALKKPAGEPALVRGMVGAALVTFAISADNAASYLPILRATSGATEWLLVSELSLLFALLVSAAMVTSRVPLLERLLRRAGRFVEPPLYGLLGIAVLSATGIV